MLLGTGGFDTTFELGASLISKGRVVDEASSRLEEVPGGTVVVVEEEVVFPPGQVELVSSAHALETDEIAALRSKTSWPDPGTKQPVLAPIALLQPSKGVFFSNGNKSESGARAIGPGTPVRADRPLAMVGLVCAGKRRGEPLILERELEGESSVAFDPITADVTKGNCVQFRDVVPGGALGQGYFQYRVVVFDGDREVKSLERNFSVDQKGHK